MTHLLRACFCIFSLLNCLSAEASENFRQNPQISDKKEIRKFNFLNAFYDAGCVGEGVRVRIKNGKHEGGTFEIDVLVSYGDLTGDGAEEAAVVVQCDGAAQSITTGKIYTVRNHRLHRLATLETGAKNFSYLGKAVIKNKSLFVTRGPGADKFENQCPENNVTQFKFVNGKLRQTGKPVCVKF